MTNGRGNGWAKHYQRIWEDRSGDPKLPPWLRVSALAYGMHRANGHAMFGVGDVRLVLSRVDEETGEILMPSTANVSHAIRKAVDFGFLEKGSGTRCLVVPGHAIEGGLGDPNEPCPQHRRQSQRGGSVRARRLKVVS
jgi:hypothetical protein